MGTLDPADSEAAYPVAVLLKGWLVLQVGPPRGEAPRLRVDVQRAVHARRPRLRVHGAAKQKGAFVIHVHITLQWLSKGRWQD